MFLVINIYSYNLISMFKFYKFYRIFMGSWMPECNYISQLNLIVYFITGQMFLNTRMRNISVRFEAFLINISFIKMPVI